MIKIIKTNWLFLIIISAVVLYVSLKSFDDKMDTNGDNCYYYIFAKSIITGHGYADLSAPGNPPSSGFPPGYPILLAPFLLINDSWAFTNASGYLFLWAACLLVFIVLIKNKFSKGFALFASIAVSLNGLFALYATKTMSEVPFAFFTMLFIYFLSSYSQLQKSSKKNIYLAVCILLAVYTQYIRVQGMILCAAFLLFLLLRKEWKNSLITIAGFIIGYMPWYIRNKMLGLPANRYMAQILERTVHEPGAGLLPIMQLPKRIVKQFGDLITNPLPTTVLNFANYDEHKSYLILGLIVLAFIVIGCLSIKRIKFWLLFFIVGNFALISIWTAPSGNRYLTCVVPVLLLGFYTGIYKSIIFIINKLKINTNKIFSLGKINFSIVVWMIITLVFSMLTISSINALEEIAEREYPFMTHIQNIIQYSDQHIPADAIFCINKPEMFYALSGRKAVKCLDENATPQALITDMVNKHVDYVLVTFEGGDPKLRRSLIKAIQKYSGCFSLTYSLEETKDDAYSKIYLLKLDREKAKNIH